MAFFWLRRAWRIQAQHACSVVALRRGKPPPSPQKHASAAGLLDLAAGAVAVAVVVVGGMVSGWLAGWLDCNTWTAMGGSTL